MPPYHTVTGSSLVIYLDLSSDSDGTLGNLTDNILAQLAIEWVAIATANGLALTLALGPNTPAPMNAIPPNLNVIPNATPPANVEFFKIMVGRGASADQATRSAQISYVNYQNGKGYVYEIATALPLLVPAVSHELGHILGLADRYYEAMYWLKNRAINRSCWQIRKRMYTMGLTDFRDGVADNSTGGSNSPRLALRLTLPIRGATVADPGYNPLSNLMSSGAASLTPGQVGVILGQTLEQTYRKTNWVAILGDWQRYTTLPTNIPLGVVGAGFDFPAADNFNDLSKWGYPTWEATAQDGGQGLLFLPPGHLTPHRYACVTPLRRGKNQNGDLIHATRLAVARGKKRVFAFGGTTYNVIGVNVVHPNWMCHTRQVIGDLT